LARGWVGAALLLAAPAAAQAAGAFGGVELGAFRHSFDTDRVLRGNTKSDSATVFGLKGGYKGANSRIYGTVHLPRTEDDDHTAYWFNLAGDYLLPASGSLTPFAGANVGYYGYDIEDRYGSKDYGLTAYTVGLEAGVLFSLFQDEAEITYRYAFGLGSSDNGRGFDGDLRSVVSVTFGVNFGGGAGENGAAQ